MGQCTVNNLKKLWSAMMFMLGQFMYWPQSLFWAIKFKQINILTLASQNIYENLLYVKKNCIIFVKSNDILIVIIRNTNNSNNKFHNFTNSFKWQCVRLYNKNPVEIQNYSLTFKTYSEGKSLYSFCLPIYLL